MIQYVFLSQLILKCILSEVFEYTFFIQWNSHEITVEWITKVYHIFTSPKSLYTLINLLVDCDFSNWQYLHKELQKTK